MSTANHTREAHRAHESRAMTIGEAATRSGASARMIRHYENIGLMPSAARTEAGYRAYGETDVAILRFIRRARGLGFSLEEIGRLLDLWRDRSRASSEVKAVVDRHTEEIEHKIAELCALRESLAELARHCQDHQRPECPILEQLVEPEGGVNVRGGNAGNRPPA